MSAFFPSFPATVGTLNLEDVEWGLEDVMENPHQLITIRIYT